MTTLAELRLANLREQKKSAAEPAGLSDPASDAASAKIASAEIASDSAAVSAVPQVIPAPPAPMPLAPMEREEDLVLSQFMSPPDPLAAPLDPEAERSAALMTRIQTLLAVKTLHPNGAKATVDMSPTLFHRAKRYCLDHGNVTLRQLFLDLLTAFLDEEGY